MVFFKHARLLGSAKTINTKIVVKKNIQSFISLDRFIDAIKEKHASNNRMQNRKKLPLLGCIRNTVPERTAIRAPKSLLMDTLSNRDWHNVVSENNSIKYTRYFNAVFFITLSFLVRICLSSIPRQLLYRRTS